MAHIIDREFVGDLTKLAAPLATAIAEATITKVFSDAIVPIVVKFAAQAADAQLVAERAADDAVEAMQRAQTAKAALAEELTALTDDIHAQIESTLPMGAALINHRR